MKTEEFREKICEVIRESTETEYELSDEKYLSGDLELSSMEVFILIADLEHAFGISIPPDRLRYVQTVGDLCDLVVETVKKCRKNRKN